MLAAVLAAGSLYINSGISAAEAIIVSPTETGTGMTQQSQDNDITIVVEDKMDQNDDTGRWEFNEKTGDTIEAKTYGSKESANIQEHLVQEFMQLTVKDHDVKINDNGLVSRIVDGKEVLINEDLAKEIKERNQKLTAKKGPKIKDEKEGR